MRHGAHANSRATPYTLNQAQNLVEGTAGLGGEAELGEHGLAGCGCRWMKGNRVNIDVTVALAKLMASATFGACTETTKRCLYTPIAALWHWPAARAKGTGAGAGAYAGAT